jgi:transcriptional regulator with XRE-family HTH domain
MRLNAKENEFSRRFVEKLKQIRMNKNLTQEFMGEGLRPKHSSAYAKIERGEKRLEFEEALKISSHLKMTLDEIMNYGEKKSDEFGEPATPYGKPKKNQVQLSLTIDGEYATLDRNIEMLRKVHEALSSIDDQI